jgi:hypothetical protein
VPVQLTSASPAQFASADDCDNTPVGFVLSGPGVQEGRLGGDIAHFDLLASGAWQGRGGGGQLGLVAGRDTNPHNAPDGGPPSPSYTLQSGLCTPEQGASVQAIVEVIHEIEFTLGGVAYTTNFDTNPNGTTTAYYVQVKKAY